jgi:NAD(P)-dependent dehydrogenase (short-subunit alcohol dehydrogenase family)
MSGQKCALIVGGSSGIGLEVGKALAARGEQVLVTSRDQARADAAAKEIGKGAKGVALDISNPTEIAGKLASIASVDHLVLAAIERDANSVKNYDISRAIRLVTLKLVGYTETIHTLVPRLTPGASIVLFGGQARAKPYPGSTTVTTINGGVTALVGTLAVELAPIRVNAIHPGVIADSPAWAGKAEATGRAASRTPGGSTATMEDCVHATLFLLDNQGVNGVNLEVDRGWTLT